MIINCGLVQYDAGYGREYDAKHGIEIRSAFPEREVEIVSLHAIECIA